jgi:hypothetical protein
MFDKYKKDSDSNKSKDKTYNSEYQPKKLIFNLKEIKGFCF